MPMYRRREQVEADRAIGAGVIQSPDGPASYLPGDWIVKTRRDEVYIVKARDFDRLFEEVLAPGCK
jgi:hypothetical protein